MTKQTTPFAIAPFDASEYLENEEVIAEYLAAASEDPNPACFRVPLPTSPRPANGQSCATHGNIAVDVRREPVESNARLMVVDGLCTLCSGGARGVRRYKI